MRSLRTLVSLQCLLSLSVEGLASIITQVNGKSSHDQVRFEVVESGTSVLVECKKDPLWIWAIPSFCYCFARYSDPALTAGKNRSPSVFNVLENTKVICRERFFVDVAISYIYLLTSDSFQMEIDTGSRTFRTTRPYDELWLSNHDRINVTCTFTGNMGGISQGFEGVISNLSRKFALQMEGNGSNITCCLYSPSMQTCVMEISLILRYKRSLQATPAAADSESSDPPAGDTEKRTTTTAAHTIYKTSASMPTSSGSNIFIYAGLSAFICILIQSGSCLFLYCRRKALPSVSGQGRPASQGAGDPESSEYLHMCPSRSRPEQSSNLPSTLENADLYDYA